LSPSRTRELLAGLSDLNLERPDFGPDRQR
jgi:hypothetical protein